MEHSQDDYWLESQRGYDFDAVHGQSVSRDSNQYLASNQFNPVHVIYNGLDEVVENSGNGSKVAGDFIPLRTSPEGPESHALKFTESDLLLMITKKGHKTERSGPEKTVRNMILGLEYSLTEYKSKKDKLELLKAAEKSHDGNTIIEVVLYLRNTLKKSIFQREIVAYPGALNVYLAYLEEDHETDELANMLLLADKAEDAAFLRYESAVRVEDPERKLQRIENCLSTHFQSLILSDSLNQSSIEEHYRLLKEQIEFLKTKMVCSVDETEMAHFENLTGKRSVIDSSVICSLMYGCLFYYKTQESVNVLTCPQKLMTSYHLTKKQFTWTALRALSELKKWSDIDDLFMSKNWLGSFKVRSCISFSRVLEVLYKAQAPIEILAKYVSFVENDHEKLNLAKKYACHSVAIEVLKNNKDRLGLISYKSLLDLHSVELISIIEALNNPTTRWKN